MLKIRNLLLVVLASCLYMACKTDPLYDKEAQLSSDLAKITHYLDSTKQTADFKKDPRGFYYQVINIGPDTGKTALPDDSIRVHYIGRTFPEGTLFDSTATSIDDTVATKLKLADAIEGWQKGIPLIKVGGRIRLLIPAALGYQNRRISTILLPNTNLDFDIRLIPLHTKKVPTTP